MYRSQAEKILDMMEQCENQADYRDMRRLMNRYISGLNKWPSPPKKVPRTTHQWDVEGDYSTIIRDAGAKLLAALRAGNCEYVHYNVCSVPKIALIKALRDFGGYPTPGSDGHKYFYIGLVEAKNFVEKYFTEWL